MPDLSIKDQIEAIKELRKDSLPEVQKYKEQWDSKQHEIYTDLIKYPQRKIKSSYIDENGAKKESSKIVDIVRIGMPYQKIIVRTAAAFFCGIPVKYSNRSEDEDIYQVFQKLIQKAKIKFIDSKIYKETAKFTESAELWYWVEKSNDYYGHNTKFEIGVKVLSPEEYDLYPEFDNYGKMTRFSRGWIEKKETETEYFETFTKETQTSWKRTSGGEWEEIESKPNVLGKIPIVYYPQDEVEWHDVQDMIERLEEIQSNIGESNDRFAFPILKIKGNVKGQMVQDKAGRVLQMEGDTADADFVAQSNAAENLIMEIQELKQNIYDMTNTPNLSPEALKGLGNLLSGIAMRYFFMNAHLKVMEKQAIYEPNFLRRVSIVQEIIKLIIPSLKNQKLDVDVVISPYVIDSKEDMANFLMNVSGGQPLYSQKRAMEEFGISDPEAMQEEIEDETNRRADFNNAEMFF